MIKALMKIGAFIGVLVLAYTVYYWDAITGQWKFEALCKKEGGSRFYAPVEKDVGWEVVVSDGNKNAYESPFYFKYVSFVRFKDGDGSLKDVYIGKDKDARLRVYDIRPANINLNARYGYSVGSFVLPDDKRMSRSNTVLIDLRGGGLVATYTSFSYEWTSPDKTFINAPTSITCHGDFGEYDLFMRSVFEFRR
jgi:hypothetical protein